MTKKPEELTEEWKAGKLDFGFYYVKGADDLFGVMSDYALYKVNLSYPNNEIELLSEVPTYDKYRSMQDQIADASKTIEKLEDQIADASKKVEWLEEKFTVHKENCCCLENEKLQLDNNKLQDELANLKKWEKHTWDYDLQAKRISELLTDNKKMQEQVVRLNKYIEQWQKAYQNTVTENCSVKNECAGLRALLRECEAWMSWAYAELYEYDPEHESKNTENLLTRINAALGCNETQANSVADIKIQESEVQ